MRILRFRAWNSEEKKMYFATLQEIINGVGFDYSVPNNVVGFIPDSRKRIYEQWTELKDSNDKMIFEGDIIEGNLYNSRLPTMGEVIFDDHFGCWSNKNQGGETMLFQIAAIKVIGNIHEDKHLLGVNP